MEALSDFNYFAGFVPTELSRALINAETDLIINGSTSGGPTGMTGVLAVSGTLTRATGSDTPLDAIQLAFNDVRVGPAFATADLVAMHPTTWNALRRQKTTFNSYILAPDPATGQVNTPWGVTVVANTKIPVGKAVVLDTTQSLLAWTRWGMLVEANPYGDAEWTQNFISFRCEERIGLGVRRASAICVVTGLPTS
jgi:HK97 family phage major capsid protein